jgi:peptidyl-prolyl cis-trans isomerase B (cyclophilin B)
VIEAFGVNAPVTVTAMTALAKGGFFDQTLCHRLTTEGIYVLQCGDPTATGRGGPNFFYNDENLPQATDDNYPAGTVAMANSGANTNGSQFFIVYEDTSLSPNYTIWGKVVRGLEIVKAIAKDGVVDGKTDGLPKRKIAIERVKVR